MKQRVNVKTSTGKRRIGIWNHETDKIRIAGHKPKPRSFFAKLGSIIMFEKWK